MKVINKTILIIGLMIIALLEPMAQNICLTPAESPNIQHNTKLLKSASPAGPFCLKIYAHIVRKSDGSRGLQVADVIEGIKILNTDFNPHNIFFVWNGNINYIDNDYYYPAPDDNIFSVDNHSDGIDIYFFDDYSYPAAGNANGVGGSSEMLIAGRYSMPPYTPLVKSHIISHEMGHVLFLWHTHHGTVHETTNDHHQCPELVDGSNSATCGDYIEDTPADPNMNYDVAPSTCVWNGTGTDANGDSYDPDETLIMAYSALECASTFSTGQAQRMRNAIQTLDHLKNATVDCNAACPDNLTITQKVLYGRVSIKSARNSIVATNSIVDNGAAVYTAGSSIRFAKGFHSHKGSCLSAKLGECNAGILKSDQEQIPVEDNKPELKGAPVFSLYPNPTNGELTIRCQADIISNYKVIIYNTVGNPVIEEELVSTEQHIEIEKLKSGIYFVRFLNNNLQIQMKKLVVN